MALLDSLEVLEQVLVVLGFDHLRHRRPLLLLAPGRYVSPQWVSMGAIIKGAQPYQGPPRCCCREETVARRSLKVRKAVL